MGVNKCDDGNLENGDGCNSECEIEIGWKCSGGNQNQRDICQKLSDIDVKITPQEGSHMAILEFTKDVIPQGDWNEILTVLGLTKSEIFKDFVVTAMSKSRFLINFESYPATQATERFEIRIQKPFLLLDSQTHNPVVFSALQVSIDFSSKLGQKKSSGATKGIMTSTTAALGTSFVTLAVTGSAKLVMKMMDSLQIIPLIPLMTINFTPLSLELFKTVKFATYNWIPNLFSLFIKEDNDNENKRLLAEEVALIKFKENGFEIPFLLNSGRFMTLIICFISLNLIVRPLKLDKAEGPLRILADLTSPNFLIKIALSAYSLIMIGSLLQLIRLRFLTLSAAASSILSLIIFGFLIFSPVLLYSFLSKNQENLAKKAFQDKYGAFYSDFRYNSFWGRNYIVLNLVTISIFCMCLVCFSQIPYLQILGALLSGIIALIVVGSTQPYKTKKENYIQIFIEVLIILLLLAVLGHMLEKGVENPSAEGGVASKLIIALMILVLVVNLGISFGAVFKELKKYCSNTKTINKRTQLINGKRIIVNPKNISKR